MNYLGEILEKDLGFEFAKGVAITFVIMLHAFESSFLQTIGHVYHIGHAVPIFILITFIVSFRSLSKKAEYGFKYWYSIQKWKKMSNRVLLPFLLLQVFFLCIFIILGDKERIYKNFVVGGGVGPGSYYPWIYLQFWLVMPILYFICKKFKFWGGVLIVLLNELFQILFCIIAIPDSLYRLLACRYLFLAFLAYVFINYNVKTSVYVLFAFLGIVYYLCLGNLNFEPLLYNSWMTQQLPAFFLTIVLVKLVLMLYNKIKDNVIGLFFVILGSYSWYIFLYQMFWFTVTKIQILSFVPFKTLQNILYFFGIYFLCIIPIIIYSSYKENNEKSLYHSSKRRK